MQSALFARRAGGAGFLPSRSESAVLSHSTFALLPSLLQALFTRPAPLTSSSPSYHSSSVGDGMGSREQRRMTAALAAVA